MADFDLIVIGSGPGGYVAAIRASQLGQKVAIVERESLGGICLNWGCIPTKALLKSGEKYESLSHLADYGLSADKVGFDFGAIIKRSRGVAAQMNKGVAFLMKKNKIEVIEGDAKLDKGKAAPKVVIALKDGKKLRDLTIGGKPEGLALTKGGRELWVGDLDAPRVSIWNTATDEKITELPVDPVAIRVLASPDGKLVATSNIASGTISLFDAETRAPLKTITVSGEAAKGQVTLLFSPDSKRLYAAETGHDKIAEIDVASGEVLRRIATGKQGDGLAIAP